MRKRTLGRECALKMLYAIEIAKDDPAQGIAGYWEHADPVEYEVRDFADDLVRGVYKNIDKIDGLITKYATNWQIERMAVIDKNIMRIAVYELLYMDDVPSKVSINEAIDIAKKYGDKDSGKFVNGVIDKICKEETKAKK